MATNPVNGHILRNYLANAKQQYESAAVPNTPGPVQVGFLVACQASALLDIAMTLRDIRDRGLLNAKE